MFGECECGALAFPWLPENLFGFLDTLHAIDPTRATSPNIARLAGVLCITFALLLHGTAFKTGVRLQNTLGILKLLILVAIALSGVASLLRVPGFKLENVSEIHCTGGANLTRVQPPNNFEWSTMWEGSLSGGANAFVTGLFNVIWSVNLAGLISTEIYMYVI